MTIQRYSTRTDNLIKNLLAQRLKGALKYKRIAGYFRSSFFELVGEEIANIPEVKIVCNSDLDENDFNIAKNLESSLTERWNKETDDSDILLHHKSYQMLDELLRSKKVQIRVIQREKLFLHGKAGMIQYPDGSRKSFVGSVNETKNAFDHNYEIVWLDDDPDSANWVEEEFDALWEEAVPLPQAFIDEIHRKVNRREVSPQDLTPEELPGAIFPESPMYKNGDKLSPWQKSFVSLFLKHREIYGKARMLLADEVGLGKTLSMACSAMVSAVLGDGPILILAPSTLLYQWQIELQDKLGISSAVWATNKKAWIDPEGRIISLKGDYKQIRNCPFTVAIVSTGLIMHHYQKERFENEAEELLKVSFGMVILDEAHKARANESLIYKGRKANNLLKFMQKVACKSRHIILGTATPIQTNIEELWDLMNVLGINAQFVMGDTFSPWRNVVTAKEIISGKKHAETAKKAWNWLKNPLPPTNENSVIKEIREDNEIDHDKFEYTHDYEDLNYTTKQFTLEECVETNFFKNCNPFIRHIVLRKRKDLENKGLLDKIAVDVHPLNGDESKYMSHFQGNAILTNAPFEAAYEAAVKFCKLISSRGVVGFMKTIMLQRICSSFYAGAQTAKKLLDRNILNPDDEDSSEEIFANETNPLEHLTPQEAECLNNIIYQLSRPEAVDPKLDTIKWFLTQFKTENKTWLEHGCIIFSQYYDTVIWTAKELSAIMPEETIAVYAGSDKSGLYFNGIFNSVERETIKTAVKNKELRIVVATDAACEGLNLQTLGTLINTDLPWNPSKLEQRLGRIKRFGQKRKRVDMLNLLYCDTQDEQIYSVLSKRMQDTYDIFGSLPDSIETDWIENAEKLEKHIDIYMHERENARNAFDIRYNDDTNPDANNWEQCTKVLSRKDINDLLAKPW